MRIGIWAVSAFRCAAVMALLTSTASANASEGLRVGRGGAFSMSAPRQSFGNPGTSFGGIRFPTKLQAPLDENAAKLPGKLVYVSFPTALLVTVYDFEGKSLGNIENLAEPRGLFVDSSRNLWVTQGSWFQDPRFPQMPTVLEFKRGETRPRKRLLDPAGGAWDVTVCPNGTVYVSNQDSAGGGQGNIQVYAGGSIKATGILTYPDGFYNLSVTCDRAGNVFSGMVSNDFTSGFVLEYPGGKQARVKRIVDNIVAAGIKPDNSGNLLVSDLARSSVCEYTEAGQPTGKCVNTGGQWYFFAVRQDGKAILGANYQTSLTNSFFFPSGKLGQVYAGYNQPLGIAYDPSQDI